MSNKIILKSKIRSKVSAANLRRSGDIPVIVYGDKDELKQNLSISVNKNEFENVLDRAGKHTLIELVVEDKTYNVMIKDVQKAPIKGTILHADMYCVNIEKEIEIMIPILLEGEAPVIKKFGGIIVSHANSVKVSCLPTDLTGNIKIDLTKVSQLNSAIKAGDLILPKNVILLDDPRKLLVNVTSVKKVEEEVPAKGEKVEESAKEEKKDETK